MYELNAKLRGLAAYTPVDNTGCVRLDANESFVEPPRALLDAMKAVLEETAFNRYPDPAAGALCRAFANYYGVEPGHVTAGNGSDELISVIFQAFLQRGEAFATLEPDFSMYAQGGLLAEGRHIPITKRDWRIDVDETLELCQKERVRLLIFSNPCNPTSLVLGKEAVRRLVRGTDALVVLDEAYMDFSGQSLLGEEGDFDNLIILRTCSKAIGMAALRLGFAVAGEGLTRALRAAKSPYNVGSIPQAIGTAVLGRPALLQGALGEILASRRALLAGLGALQAAVPGRFRVLEGEANFAALVMKDACEVQKTLLKQGIAVRYTGGLLRVSCGKPGDNKGFLEAFRKVLEGKI
ncbi:pyridoxal phosphate-dependent aminotransferase [Acutalibacter caecimuris]|uniref:pyridoxal phosphate-dependent aminotransferase n=1 Tax=Acutalibacter caecimuris TaxID=3093657 RepID=UPI002AC92AEA|nr:aminotransferase class I/II-fold pyridoxal phosphate-dependent enzyme [Acutalibacter sp. M00118]